MQSVITGHLEYQSTKEETLMPVRKVKGGYRWGKSGKVYRGRGAKAKATRQGRAIRASGWREK